VSVTDMKKKSQASRRGVTAKQRKTDATDSAVGLMKAGVYSAAERRLLADLIEAERNGDWEFAAACHANIAHIAEVQQRIGDAVRHWSLALALMEQTGQRGTGEAQRLQRLIRRWHELPRAWISYAHLDKERVDAVVARLKGAQIDVRWDDWFVGGKPIVSQVHTAISQCPKYVVMWSSNAQGRPWMDYELRVLSKQRERDMEQRALDNVVIFYCLDSTPLPDEHTDDVYIRELEEGFEKAIGRLIRSITSSEISMWAPLT